MHDSTGAGAVERNHALWDRLGDFPAAETDAALLHLMRTLCDWLRTDDAIWIGGVRLAQGGEAARDPLHGWRPRAVRHLVPPPEPERAERRAIRRHDDEPAMTSRALSAEAGRFRVRRLHDGLVDLEAFRQTAHYRDFYERPGISDRLWVVFPVNVDTESYFVLDLYRTERRFTAAEAALAGEVLRGLKWLHRNLLLSHGLLVARQALTPTQRRLLALLLTDRSEAAVAEALGITPGTAHQYALALYRRLGVKGRAGLMALWLGGPRTPPPPEVP